MVWDCCAREIGAKKGEEGSGGVALIGDRALKGGVVRPTMSWDGDGKHTVR
jgi:hypothetical protein